MNEINTRLRKIRENTGLSQKKFSNKLGISQSYYAELETGRSNISRRVLLSLQSVFSININWLLTGSGNMFEREISPSTDHFSVVSSPQKSYSTQQQIISNRLIVAIPVVCSFSEEYLNENEIIDYLYLPAMHLHSTVRDVIALRVFSDSMNPVIRYGDYAIVCRGYQVEDGSVVVVNDHLGNTQIARYHHDETGSWFSKDNQKYPAIPRDSEYLNRWKILGGVVKVIRDISI